MIIVALTLENLENYQALWRNLIRLGRDHFGRNIYTMAIRVAEFSSGGIKLERFLHKNQHTQRKLLNFQFWITGKLSKIGHHFRNKVI